MLLKYIFIYLVLLFKNGISFEVIAVVSVVAANSFALRCGLIRQVYSDSARSSSGLQI